MWTDLSSVLSQSTRVRDRHTDGRTDNSHRCLDATSIIMTSYRRQTALQGGSVLAKSGRRYIIGTSIYNQRNRPPRAIELGEIMQK